MMLYNGHEQKGQFLEVVELQETMWFKLQFFHPKFFRTSVVCSAVDSRLFLDAIQNWINLVKQCSLGLLSFMRCSFCLSVPLFYSSFAEIVSFHSSRWKCKHFPVEFCSSLGQGLFTSTYVGEIIFAIIIAIVGLVLFALLIGNMQVSPPVLY